MAALANIMLKQPMRSPLQQLLLKQKPPLQRKLLINRHLWLNRIGFP